MKKLFGLVLIGGQSKRMHKDKARLEYRGQAQWRACFDLLSPFCEKVFLSTSKVQKKLTDYQKYSQIHDKKQYTGIGPVAGILSALDKHPKAAWLVLACDLPFVSATQLQTLLKKRDPQKVATAFKSSHDGLPEPLCAIYEPKARARLLKFFKKDMYCPRKFMINSPVKLLKLQNKTALDNVNNPTEYREALRKFKK